MIVDDNTFNVYSLEILIKEFFNRECDLAYSAKEAISLVKKRYQEVETCIQSNERLFDYQQILSKSNGKDAIALLN